ncbi:MAG: porin family protein [Bacteroidota bacterium]
MKKIILSIAIMMLFINSYAQKTAALKDDTLRFPKDKNKGKDIIIFDVYSDIWKGAPNNITVRTIDQGINFYLMTNHPIGTSNFSIAYGLGISSHNFHSDGVPVLERDANGIPTGKTIFETLGSHYQTTVNYKTNKLNLTYLDLPIELKFKTRDAHNRQLKFSLGFKIGYELSNHTKFVGDDVLEGTTDEVTIKKGNIKNINNWNYGVTARIGKGMFNLMCYYSLSKIFNTDGPQMYPISVGISITPY